MREIVLAFLSLGQNNQYSKLKEAYFASQFRCIQSVFGRCQDRKRLGKGHGGGELVAWTLRWEEEEGLGTLPSRAVCHQRGPCKQASLLTVHSAVLSGVD